MILNKDAKTIKKKTQFFQQMVAGILDIHKQKNVAFLPNTIYKIYFKTDP